MKRKNDHRFYILCACRLLNLALLAALLFAPFAAAWSSYETWPRLDTPLKESRSDFHSHSRPSPMPAVDFCLPLLDPSGPAAVRSQPSAGAIAARVSVLSLALGVRFALGPAQDTHEPDRATSVSSPQDSSALSVSAYRECVKRATLESRSKDARLAKTKT
jgi:hypothetical protein